MKVDETNFYLSVLGMTINALRKTKAVFCLSHSLSQVTIEPKIVAYKTITPWCRGSAHKKKGIDLKMVPMPFACSLNGSFAVKLSS